MMALLAMCMHDTEENGRSALTKQTLSMFRSTIDVFKHRIVLIDNGSCKETKTAIQTFKGCYHQSLQDRIITIILPENIGTARAINKGWLLREPDEAAVKIDNDVDIHYDRWVDELEHVVKVDPTIGIVGLKRSDCMETPWHTSEWYRSKLTMLPHERGDPWIIVEEVNHVMGTCQLYSPALLDKIGYLYQMGGLYGFDDALASIRAHVAGFKTVFLPHIPIVHLDPGGTEYTEWKSKYGWDMMQKFNKQRAAYETGAVSVYHGPEDA
jgi:GT2 family glycosyltransferase